MLRTRLLLALAVFAFTASAAHAQIGGIRRRAQDAARRATQPRGAPPKFDDTMLELNAQVVGRLIAGLEARSRARGAGGLTAGELRQRSTAAGEEAMNLNNQHSDDRAKWVDANNTAENCMSEQLSNVEQRHAQEMQQRMIGMTGVNTPEKTKFMQDFMAVSQEAQQASATGDTAAARRAQVKLNTLMGIDAHADTVNARATCHVPAMPAWMRRADSLAALADTLTVRARDAESAGSSAGVTAAGMTPAQFAMAAERAEGFVWLQDPARVGVLYVYSPTEEQALRARLVDLKKYFG